MDNIRAVIVGQPGTGKTTYAAALVGRALEAGRQVVVLTDHADRYRQHLPVLQLVGPDLARDVGPVLGRSWVLELSGWESDRQLQAAVDRLARRIWERGRLLLVVDEAHLFFPRWPLVSAMHRIVTGGRHRGVDYVMITQHLVYLHLSAVKAANYLVVFRLVEPNDLARAAYLSGLEEAAIRALPTGRAVGVNLATGRRFYVASQMG